MEISLFDYIATVVVAFAIILPVAIAAGATFYFVPWLRRSPSAKRVGGVGMIFFAISAISYAGYHNLSVNSGQYPGLADAYFEASPEQRAAMDEVISKAAPRREIFSFSLAQRDAYLEAGGYCNFRSFGACKALPPGTQPIGLVIESFPYGDRARPQAPPCTTWRCRGEPPPARKATS